MKPWLSSKDIDTIKTILLAYCEQNGPLSVLEWGSGGSTLVFSEFLHERNARFNWLAIEHNPEWFGRVKGKLHCRIADGKIPKKAAKIRLIPTEENGNLYVSLPGLDGDPEELKDVPESAIKRRKFDIVIVDGRYRRRCVIRARSLLKPSGLLLLHDAERPWYRCAMDLYEHQLWLSEESRKHRCLWVACLDPAKVPFQPKKFS